MESLRQTIADCEARFASWFAQGSSADRVLQARSKEMDQLVMRLVQKSNCQELWKDSAVVALGGYARQELNRFSDIDVMFLHKGLHVKDLEQLAADLCYPMWDAGLNVQATTRSLEDCLQVVEDDIRSQTALLESRYVWGDESLYQKLKMELAEYWSHKKNQKKFIEGKTAERLARLAKYGDSVYILEPHVKEGEGGLREYHTLRWLAAILKVDGWEAVPQEERAHLSRALNFLWRLRDAMHSKEKRRQDRLTFSLQETLAGELGFVRTAQAEGAQQLVQQYYAEAKVLRDVCQRAVHVLIERHCTGALQSLNRKFHSKEVFPATQAVEGELCCRAADPVCQDPLWGLQMMALAQTKGWRLSDESKLKLASLASTITPLSWEQEKNGTLRASTLWKQMFSRPEGLGAVLSEMHEMGWLTRWFPELAHLTHFAPRDAYHLYTVDIHTLKAIGEIERLAAGNPSAATPSKGEEKREKNIEQEFVSAYRDLERPDLLLWGLLFHDAGKGLGAEDHCIAGIELAKPCLARLGFNPNEQETILFLIQSHLIMPRIAFLRDLSDPHLIEKFALSAEDVQKLTLLYLISYADLKAVAPGVLTTWKQKLLTELYYGAHKMISGAPLATQEVQLEEKADEIREHLGMEKEEPLVLFELLPKNYLAQVPALRLATKELHYRQYLKKKPLFWLHHENADDSSHSEVLLITKDAPGLFAKIAGCLAASGLNILDAQLHTLRDGVALDWLSVQGVLGGSVESLDRWNDLQKNVESVLSEQSTVEAILEKRKASPWVLTPGPKLPALQIFFDNDISAFYTVVEIHATDRIGLLYDIAHCLYGLSLSIARAKIATEGSRVIDVFYLTNREGKKIEDKEHWKSVRDCLAKSLGEE